MRFSLVDNSPRWVRCTHIIVIITALFIRICRALWFYSTIGLLSLWARICRSISYRVAELLSSALVSFLS
uniref:Uncharacterized protein n=1 Tax=Anguilla anguilla TaxID=7936 RepID=A0A0E9WUU8_ANGAN